MKTLQDLSDLTGKKVIVRVDFNVPLDDAGNVRDDKRIRHTIPTLKYLLEAGASQVILMSHVGRPKNNEPNLKTDKIAAKLSELIGEKVAKVDDWGEKGLPDAKVVMLENLRFHPGEKSKDEAEAEAFSKQLAGLADVYVNEAFSNSHRKHASMMLPKLMPGCVGFGVEKEVSAIKKALESPEHPVVAVIGGLKADKLTAINNLLNIADDILVAGALAFTLLKAQGKSMGASKIDDEGLGEMGELVEKMKGNEKIHLPVDCVVADKFAEDASSKDVSVDEVEDGWMALDIGPETVGHYVAKLKEAKTILWFGPIGVFEMEKFSHGTKMIGRTIAESDAVSIVGGGDSASAVEAMGLTDRMTLVSTGGGASLQMIEGKELPAIKILE
ncbi:phosphoglycerate kinase [Candidatus Peregrinibacteria bacterium]|nr:phosphoglycerate kinase [Candidatus Peregrinibacteria bacterium]